MGVTGSVGEVGECGNNRGRSTRGSTRGVWE